MEFKALDNNFNLLDIIVSSNIQWNRKYYTVGDFEIEIPMIDYDSNMKYIYCPQRPEVGMIQKVANSQKNILLSGYFLERKMFDKIVYPTFYGRGDISDVCINMINQFKEDIPINSIQKRESGSNVDFQATGDELGRKLYEVLQTQEMSYKVTYDYVNGKINLIIYKGDDKTQDSGVDDPVTFSTSWNNLSDIELNVDNSNFKNYFVVAGTGQADERITVDVDLSNGTYKQKLFVDERNTKYNPDEQTLDEYKAELRQKGLEKALDYEVIENVSFKVDPTSYGYMVDYDLGTKVDTVITELNMAFETRITEIHEVFKDGLHSIEVEVGNPVKKKFQNIRI